MLRGKVTDQSQAVRERRIKTRFPDSRLNLFSLNCIVSPAGLRVGTLRMSVRDVAPGPEKDYGYIQALSLLLPTVSSLLPWKIHI